MDFRHQNVVGKKIASILAENEATVDELPDIFKAVRRNLTVTAITTRREGYNFAAAKLKFSELTDDGDRIPD